MADNGREIVQEWEARQERGQYKSYYESMTDLAKMIDDTIAQSSVKPPAPTVSHPRRYTEYEYEESDKDRYHERQRTLREAGFTPYNCDEVDEFPRL